MKEYLLRCHSNGNKFWYLDGKLHREDGPAIEYADGIKKWFICGKHHREDGPAIERPNGNHEWYLNDIEYSEEEHQKKLNPAKEILETFKTFGYTAIVYPNGDRVWYLDGKLHREDGPAIEYANGMKSWWLNGNLYTEEEYQKALNL